jgi:hypothetical protein
MSTQDMIEVRGADDLIERAGRWLLAKVWLGCLLSGGYAAGNHFGWPQGLRTFAAVIAAVVLAVVSVWLPAWTRQRPSGVAVADVGLRVLAWLGLTVCVVCLLLGAPAVGAAAGALLLSTAWRTFGDRVVRPAGRAGRARRADAGNRPGHRARARRENATPARQPPAPAQGGHTGRTPTGRPAARRARRPTGPGADSPPVRR